jgi:peptidoglycan hydrolase-like protein with peptidoglycan-binding domain
VRKRATRSGRSKAADGDVGGGLPMLRALGWSARDAVAVVMAALATVAILVNVLLMQKGSHPAPMFKGAAAPAKAAVVAEPIPPAVPRPRAAEATLASAAGLAPAATKPAPATGPRTPGEIITDIQRELARRGYYDGPIDGLYGPRTDGAIRDFEQAASFKPSTEPSEALLQSILRAQPKLARGTTGATASSPPRPPLPVRPEAARETPRNDVPRTDVPERPTPNKRLIALQRALADFGYGQIKPSGIVDAETQAAIEKFERERKLPVTGQPSDRVMREMTSMTGRTFD